MSPLSRVARAFTRRPDVSLVRLLRDQVTTALTAVDVAYRAALQDLTPAEAAESMKAVSAQAHWHRSATVGRLAGAFANPIDREDLFRLSRSIEDTGNNVADYVHELALFDVPAHHGQVRMLEAIAGALADLDQAVQAIVDNPLRIREASLAVRRNEIRRRYQEAVAQTLSGEVDAASLKNRELLRRLDVVGLRLGEAADALADGAVKRSH